MRTLAALLLCLLLSSYTDVSAQSDPYVPEALEPWRAWVLEGKNYRECPFFFNRVPGNESAFVCVWPGALSLDVRADGARFSQSWTAYAPQQWLTLPGDARLWPQQVTINGRSVVVVDRNGAPSIQVDAGSYTVRGEFSWQQRPGTLPMPTRTGLVELTQNGARVARPERNSKGIWLGERKVVAQTEDALEVQVYRVVQDNIPTRLGTQLQLNVAGSVREVTIGALLPAGFTPLILSSDLPAKIEPDGTLRLQVRPGYWTLQLVARASGVLDELTLPARGKHLPTTEVWSFASNNVLRIVAPEGLQPVDPLQTDVPEDWEELPAYRIEPGQTLTLSERSRGKTAAENRLRLERKLWMDFDGQGFVFNDQITGDMRVDWRLEMQKPYTLLSASEFDNLLVTRGGDDTLSGIEVRQRELGLSANGRLESRASVPVTGWQTRFDNVTTRLYLPTGSKLLAAPGADRAFGSWLQQWRLLDFFLVLITAVASMRLFGPVAGALALFVLMFSLHEPGAPAFLWLNLLVATALARLAPAGRLLQLSKFYRTLSVIALLVIFVPYAALQLRAAIYPQLQGNAFYGLVDYYGGDEAYEVTSKADGMTMQVEQSEPRSMAADSFEEIVVTGSRLKTFERYAPDAVVPVGPGTPEWTRNSYRLSWSGPVATDQELKLIVMPRWLVSLLRIVTVLLMGALVAVFVLEWLNRRPPWLRGQAATPPAPGTSAAMLAVATMIGLMLPTPQVQAQMPSSELLQQLEVRLLAAPECAPNCADILSAQVTVNANDMIVRLTTNALEAVAIPLPGSINGWRPEVVTVNDRNTTELFSDNGTLWLRIEPGIQRIVMRGPLPPVDGLELPFVRPPKTISVQADDAWLVSGVNNGQLSSGSLQLTRQRLDANDPAVRWESSRFPTFVRVERTINMNLDWRVVTNVYRVAPEQGAISVRIPLLPGETVQTEGTNVAEGRVSVAFAPGQNRATWQSVLPRNASLTFEAPSQAPFSEVWRFAIGSIWHAKFSGVPESETNDGNSDYRVAQFHPRNGETLKIDIERPEAIVGDTLAFDATTMREQIGQRSRTVSLSLDYRSTRGAQHDIALPENASITNVAIDGVATPLRTQFGKLTLPIVPGEHTIGIEWQSDQPLGWMERASGVDIGASLSNVRTTINMPRDRWILAVSGPTVGPAVLYWSELAALILLAFVLGRIPLTPLNTLHWFLLGLGFSTFSWSSLTVIAIWLLVLGGKEKLQASLGHITYNLTQVAIGLLSLIALSNIVWGLPQGLLGSPDMSITGNGSSSGRLMWFSDRAGPLLPDATVYSVPMWCYKVLILGWALWLSFALLRWLPWAWQQFSKGTLWRSKATVQSER